MPARERSVDTRIPYTDSKFGSTMRQKARKRGTSSGVGDSPTTVKPKGTTPGASASTSRLPLSLVVLIIGVVLVAIMYPYYGQLSFTNESKREQPIKDSDAGATRPRETSEREQPIINDDSDLSRKTWPEQKQPITDKDSGVTKETSGREQPIINNDPDLSRKTWPEQKQPITDTDAGVTKETSGREQPIINDDSDLSSEIWPEQKQPITDKDSGVTRETSEREQPIINDDSDLSSEIMPERKQSHIDDDSDVVMETRSEREQPMTDNDPGVIKESRSNRQPPKTDDYSDVPLKVVKENDSSFEKQKLKPKTNGAINKPNKNTKKKSKSKKTTKNEDASIARMSDSSADQELPKEVRDFKPTILKTMKPKKIFVDGRRLPPIELLPQKPNNSSVKVFLYNEFLSEAECDGLMKVHDSHVKQASEHDPFVCFDSIQTLRRHLKVNGIKVKVTPRDFMPRTMCVNASFSSQLKTWFHSNWSYSTAFYPGESKFSHIFAHRVKEATSLAPENGGKFQITSYTEGIGYKTHTDCMENTDDQRDRMATILVYLQDVEEGGETMFPELGIWVKPRKGRALVWNNMNEDGYCEPMSVHKAAKVEKGNKYILQRWYYYKSFYSLGKRPPEPEIPKRAELQGRVSCDEYEHGSCRWYDEWNYDHMIEYLSKKATLI